MNTTLQDIKTSVIATVVLALICSGLYPVAVWALAQIFWAQQANGSLLTNKEGGVIGSALLGQNFNAPAYFHPRPSAAGAAGYDATSSSGSNLGPTSQKLAEAVKQRVAEYRQANQLPENQAVPADAVTASGSGLDPHISGKNAALQAARIARVRGLTEEQVLVLVRKNTTVPDLGFLGEAGVNVLTLNLALDRLNAKP
jgi:K+-transporting ATPase ATPase C chain